MNFLVLAQRYGELWIERTSNRIVIPFFIFDGILLSSLRHHCQVLYAFMLITVPQLGLPGSAAIYTGSWCECERECE